MKMLRRYQVAGFSLVELMVVVAIIGILAAVAIPNFNKFQRRARAAEAKSALGALFDSQKSFLAEWEDYCTSMAAIGYTFDGTSRTDLNTGAAVAAGTCATRYQAEATAAWANTMTGTFNLLSAGICGNPTFMPGCMMAAGALAPLALGATSMYTAGALGVPGTFTATAGTNVGSSMNEEWTMDQFKVFAQQIDGVNAN